jgi:hypothetical protein
LGSVSRSIDIVPDERHTGWSIREINVASNVNASSGHHFDEIRGYDWVEQPEGIRKFFVMEDNS